MKFTVTVYSAHDDSVASETGVDRISFVDNDSHGPMTNFGINTQMRVGEKVAFVAPPNIELATVERTA